ncbi:unnamed protein product [Effrenium voratum]|nr:unnamed protein product [Effrenium voratum]
MAHACFVATWHSKHSRQCPDAEAIKKDMLEKAGGPQAMMKNGSKFLMAVAIKKVFTEGPEPIEKPPEMAKSAPVAPEAPAAPAGPGDEELRRYRAEVAELQEAAAKEQELSRQLKAELAQAETSAAQLRQEAADETERLQRALREVSGLEKQLQSVAADDVTGDLQQLKAEAARLRAENTDKWRDIAGLRAENNDLKDDLSDAKKALRQAEEAAKQALDRSQTVEEELKASGDPQQQQRLVSELESSQASEGQLRSEVAQTRQELEDAEARSAALQRGEQHAQAEWRVHAEELTSATEEQDALRSTCQSRLEELTRAAAERESLQQEASEQLREMESIRRELAAQHQEGKVWEQRAGRLAQEHREAEEQVLASQRQLENATELSRTLEAETQVLQSKVRTFQAQLESEEEEAAQLRDEVGTLQMAREEVEQERAEGCGTARQRSGRGRRAPAEAAATGRGAPGHCGEPDQHGETEGADTHRAAVHDAEPGRCGPGEAAAPPGVHGGQRAGADQRQAEGEARGGDSKTRSRLSAEQRLPVSRTWHPPWRSKVPWNSEKKSCGASWEGTKRTTRSWRRAWSASGRRRFRPQLPLALWRLRAAACALTCVRPRRRTGPPATVGGAGTG